MAILVKHIYQYNVGQDRFDYFA